MQDNFKSGFATILGRPNVGKSTLMNEIIGQKIAITSNKPQTTRNRIMTVYSDDEGQIVFLDTPGLHKAKNKLGNYMMNAATVSLKDADVVVFLIEASKGITSGEREIIEKLKTSKAPKILVINKIDMIKKEDLIELIRKCGQEVTFDEVVPVSATEGTNVKELVSTIMKYLPYGEPFYDEDTVTDLRVVLII